MTPKTRNAAQTEKKEEKVQVAVGAAFGTGSFWSLLCFQVFENSRLVHI